MPQRAEQVWPPPVGALSKASGFSLSGLFTSIRYIFPLSDLLAIVTGALFASLMVSGSAQLDFDQRVAVVVAVLLDWTILSTTAANVTWRGRGFVDYARSATTNWLAVLAALLFLSFIMGHSESYSRPWALGWWLAAWLLIILSRVIIVYVARMIYKRGVAHRKVVIVGAGPWGEEVGRRIEDAEWLGLDVSCYVDSDHNWHGKRINGAMCQGGYDTLANLVSKGEVDEVWICLPLRSSRTHFEDEIDEIQQILRHSTVTQRMVPNLAEMRLLHRPVREIMGLPVVDLSTSPMQGVNRIAKAVEDRVLALLFLVLMSPLMLGIAIAVRLSSEGPILFRQKRHGWDGRPVTIYKFRTMYVHHERPGEVTQARRGDPRVTGVGAFLRRTSLDELPQLINVLQGRMSIVGPRPHAIEHNRYFMDRIESYMQRHKVKPGITGLAQVNGHRGETDTLEKMKKRVEYDLYYIEHWSVWLDIKIILRTLYSGLVHANAY